MKTIVILLVILGALTFYGLGFSNSKKLGYVMFIALMLLAAFCGARGLMEEIAISKYEAVSVCVVTDEGVVEVVEKGYYKDAEGNYYQKVINETQEKWNPFYFPSFEKVEAPVFEFDDLNPTPSPT